jgi:hypothetical protein
MDAKHQMHKTLKEAAVGGLLAFVLGFMAIWLTPARADDFAPMPITPKDALYHPVWNRAACGSVCTVTYSPGGNVDEYLQQVESIKRDKITLKIDGPCISACTMTADHARTNVCVTPNASLQFHNGITVTSRGETVIDRSRFDPSEYYSADINGWVADHGGFPGKDTSPEEMGKFLVMPFSEAKRFFKVCK